MDEDSNNTDSKEKKLINKAKSYAIAHALPFTMDPVKRKSFNVNGAVKSLDLALGRLKRSKLVNGEYSMCRETTAPAILERTERVPNPMTNASSHFNYNTDNASLMSMNFSHYELMRNLSCSNCNSETTFSTTTCCLTPSDDSQKDEQLERYFRSMEMWSRKKDLNGSTIHFECPEK